MTKLSLAVPAVLLAGAVAAQEPSAPSAPSAQPEQPAAQVVPASGQVPAPAAPAVTVAGGPWTISGSIWVDTGYLDRDNTQPSEPDEKVPYMTGRVVLGAAYRRKVGGLTATAKAELLGLAHEYRNSDYEPHAQDVYLMLSGETWDVQVGRFLGTEVYYRGQGIELYTAEEAGAKNGVALYHLNLARGQLDGPGQVAVHYQPFQSVKLELGTVYGFTNSASKLAARPVIDVSAAGLRFVAGYEWMEEAALKADDEAKTTQKGYGARLQYTWRGVTVGADYAARTTDRTTTEGTKDTDLSGDLRSVGGFVDAEVWDLVLGAGYHLTSFDNEQDEQPWHKQAFGSVLYKLPIDGLSVKAVYGFARAKIEDIGSHSEFENDLQSFRIRLAYEFR